MRDIEKTWEEPARGEVYEPFKPYDLEASVCEAIKDLEEQGLIRKSDKGVIELCRQYARRIDLALAQADLNPDSASLALAATKALYLGPHLLNALRVLGGTPGDRMDLEEKRKPKKAASESEEAEEDPIASFLRENTKARSRK